MPGATEKVTSKGFTLVELMIVIAILGVLAAISIPNYRLWKDRAEYASMLTTLKYLMDGEDFYFLENGAFFPVRVPRGKAKEIPQLACNFSEGHKNAYRIRVRNNRRRNRYVITVNCDFDSDGNGKKDRFRAITNIVRGEVRRNREIRQLR